MEKQQQESTKKQQKVPKSIENGKVDVAPNKKSELKKTSEDQSKTKETHKTIKNDSEKQQENRSKKNKKRNKADERQESFENLSEKKPDPLQNKKVKKRSVSYIDPEFDNNTFKLLNLEDSGTDDESVSTTHSFITTEKENISDHDSQPITKPSKKTKKQQEVLVSKAKSNERKQSTESVSAKKTVKQDNVTQSTNVNSNVNKQKLLKSTAQKLASEPQTIIGQQNTNKNAHKELKQKRMCSNEYRPEPMLSQNKSNGISIMEQLSRGVRVEGLKLPPGITLTRVDPAKCETIKAKKESISKIVHPMQPVPQHVQNIPYSYNDPAYMPVHTGPTRDSIIMVDTPKSNVDKNDTSRSNKNKRNRKKKKSVDENLSKTNQQNHEKFKMPHINGDHKQNPMMITLRNPMFNPVTETIKKQPSMNNRSPSSYDQPAAIIKNENGMFTIRNPALHQALSQGEANTLPHYNAYNMPNVPHSNGPSMSDVPYSGESLVNGGRKCNSVIGSEIKTAHQIKQAQQKERQMGANWNINKCDTSGMYGLPFTGLPGVNKSYSAFEPSYSGGGFNSDFIGSNDFSHKYFNDPSSYCGADKNVGAFTSNRNTYSSVNHNYFENGNGINPNYDDAAFLQNLQPGQRLNSEVSH